MSVVTSSLEVGHVQLDGRKYVRETHSLSDGRNIVFSYLATEGTDYNSIMAERVNSINLQLAEEEARLNIGRDSTIVLNSQTAVEFREKLRQAFREAEKEEACRLAWWFLRRIAAGDITETQARNIFGLTLVQWNTFKTNKLQPRSDAWAAVLAATGE